MQNSNGYFEPATANQINLLKRWKEEGKYSGRIDGLTKGEASDIIRAAQENKPNQQPTVFDTQYQQPEQQPSATYQQPQQQQKNAVLNPSMDYSITTRAGDDLTLDPQTVEAYVCKGLTETEFKYFFSVCKTYELNPFLKDIYAIKFGSQPATFIIDYKVMQQAADNNPAFDGLKVGVVYLDKNGNAKEREGAYILPNETLVAGWCDVFRKDRTHANRTYALYSENVKLTKDGAVNSNWATKPVFMIVKVAKAQALRETFPNMFSNNTYINEEFDTSNIIDANVNAEFKNTTTEEVGVEQKKKSASKKVAPESEEWLEGNE